MSPREYATSLLQAVSHPHRYFEEHPPADSIGQAAVIVFLVATLSSLAFLALGWVLSQQIDATTTVTTMEPWSDARCEPFREMNNSSNTSSLPEPCTIDEPRTKQVHLGEKAYSVFAERVPLVFFGVLLGWPITAIGLHVLSALARSEGSFGNTLAVAGVGMAPSVLQTFAVTGTMAWQVRSMTFGSDPAVVANRLRELAETTTHPVVIVAILVVAVWQAWIWAAGLERARNMDAGSAKLAAGVVALLGAIFSII